MGLARDYVLKELTTFSYGIDTNFYYPPALEGPLSVVRTVIRDWGVTKKGIKRKNFGLKVWNGFMGGQELGAKPSQQILLSESVFENLEKARAISGIDPAVENKILLSQNPSTWIEITRTYFFRKGAVYYGRNKEGHLERIRFRSLEPESELGKKFFPQFIETPEVIYS
jgi:hypothetical protein